MRRRNWPNLPWWLVGLLLVVTVVAAGSLFWLEDAMSFPPRTAGGWILLVVAVAPLYLLLEALAESAAEGLRSDRRFLVRAIPIAIVVFLYVLWYAIR